MVDGCSLMLKAFGFQNLQGLENFWGGCVVSLLGLVTTFTLCFFVGVSLFLFSVTLDSFLTLGLVLGWGSKPIKFGPNLPSSSR